MKCRPNLRMRLSSAAAILAILAIVASAIAAYGVIRMQYLASEAMAAQHRIEAYGAYNARVNDWMLGWLMQNDAPPDGGQVMQSLEQMDRLIAQDVTAARSEEEATLRAAQSRTPAQLRGMFGQLQKALAQSPPGTPAGDSAIAFYSAQAPFVTARQIEQEIRRRDLGMAGMQALRGPLLGAVAGVAFSAPLVLLALYLLVLRPLFARLTQTTRAAGAMNIGAIPARASGHDELGLMLARLQQMAARIDRRRARLEDIVAERTASLSQANERLAQIDSTRRRFFADVGHELRTPLTVIMGEAELGATHGDPQLRASFNTILTRAQRLFRRIEDILRIARSESGKLELGRTPVALTQVIEAAISDTAPVRRRTGTEVALDLPPLVAAGDGEWLRQVFTGFLENASKYAGRNKQVTITGRHVDHMAQIDIVDNGPGLPPDFNPFERFSRTGQANGFGVGLALAQWVVETSGGTLDVQPSDKGLHLRLTLPLWEEG